MTFRVAGVSFSKGYPQSFYGWARRPAGRYPRCELRREPDNPHDPNAIAVVVARRKVGHVPRETAAWLAPRIDAGEPVRAWVANCEVIPAFPTQPTMSVTVSLVATE